MAALSALPRLIYGFSSSARNFARGFLQIPPLGGHPCRSANISYYQACSGLSPPSYCPCRAYYEKAPRAVRGSFSVSFDGMILSHFCKVCIRVFRQDSDDCAFLLGSTLLPRYLLHCYADSSTCCCQAHTQVFQSLPKRKLNLFSMVFFVAHTFPFSASRWRTFFSIERYEKSPSRRAQELLCTFRRYDSNTLLCGSHPRF